ncbi:MAG: hypothetical protein KAJ55_14230, partial [Anaerolineales bacterium]|nr:hypothetical protein [Anaerolineales bacterium]
MPTPPGSDKEEEGVKEGTSVLLQDAVLPLSFAQVMNSRSAMSDHEGEALVPSSWASMVTTAS